MSVGWRGGRWDEDGKKGGMMTWEWEEGAGEWDEGEKKGGEDTVGWEEGLELEEGNGVAEGVGGWVGEWLA